MTTYDTCLASPAFHYITLGYLELVKHNLTERIQALTANNL